MDERTWRMRRVWAAVTKRPQATLKELAQTADYSYSRIGLTLKELRDAGYIAFEDRTNGARTILVPFVEIRQNDAAA